MVPGDDQWQGRTFSAKSRYAFEKIVSPPTNWKK